MFTETIKKYLIFASGPATATIIALMANFFLYKNMPDGQFGQGYFNLIVAQILAEISLLGTDQYFFRHFKDTQDDEWKLRLICGPVLTSLIVSICLTILVDKIFTLDSSLFRFFIIVYCISMSRLLQLYLRITEKGRTFSYFTILGSIIFPICVVVAIVCDIEIFVDEIIFIFTLQYAIPLILILTYLKLWENFNGLRRSYFIPSKHSLKYGLPFVLSSGIETTGNNFEKLILVSMAKASLYDDLILASRIGGAVTSLQNAITAYWVPRFFKLFRESLESLISGVKRMYKVVLAFILPTILIFYLFEKHPIINVGKSEYFGFFLFLYVIRNSLIFLSYVTYVGIDVLRVPRYHIYVSIVSFLPLFLAMAIKDEISFVRLMYLFVLLPPILTYFMRTVISNYLLGLKWYFKIEILILILLLCL